MKPFAAACERNQDPILRVLAQTFGDRRRVLEIGSGTGQHAVYFAEHLPHLTWLTSDLAVNHEGIEAWIQESGLPNLERPLDLDVAGTWPTPQIDAVFTANTFHIMAWPLVQRFLAQVGELLPSQGRLCVYGPFNYQGTYTSPSNAQFDLWLNQRDPQSAIRHFEEVVAHAEVAGLKLQEDHEMPSNNRLLHFQKQP